jgi:hypothetical protein
MAWGAALGAVSHLALPAKGAKTFWRNFLERNKGLVSEVILRFGNWGRWQPSF